MLTTLDPTTTAAVIVLLLLALAALEQIAHGPRP